MASHLWQKSWEESGDIGSGIFLTGGSKFVPTGCSPITGSPVDSRSFVGTYFCLLEVSASIKRSVRDVTTRGFETSHVWEDYLRVLCWLSCWHSFAELWRFNSGKTAGKLSTELWRVHLSSVTKSDLRESRNLKKEGFHNLSQMRCFGKAYR